MMVIVHFLPIEYYPPVTNLLNHLAAMQKPVSVYTTRNRLRTPYAGKGIRVMRYEGPENTSTLKRLWCYFRFNAGTLIGLIRKKPEKILYFETFSAYPVYLYKKYFNRKATIYIHCHEYNSKEWYTRAMKLLRVYHSKEVAFLYPAAQWISQTNENRLRLFRDDHPYLNTTKLQVLPNFPPAAWKQFKKHASAGNTGVVRCVFIGALSIEATYIVEFCEWVKKQGGKVTFDIYSFNAHAGTKAYLNSLGVEYIRYHEKGIDYDEVPAVLGQYDVGLLLYRVITLNLKYNATNKLFEYLVCGLDVWFTKGLEGCYPYRSDTAWPQVLEVDYDNLDQFNYRQAVNKTAMPERTIDYTCEDAVQPLMQSLFPGNTDNKNLTTISISH